MANSGWVQIQTALTDASGNTPYYLTATGATAGSPVVLSSTTPTGPETLWLFTLDNGNTGRIRSLVNNGMVLAVDANANLIIEPEQFPTPASQTWSLDEMWDSNGYFNGAAGIGIFEINNLQSGYIAANPWSQPVFDGMPVSAGQDGGQQIDPAYQWCLAPGATLQYIYNLPNYNNTPSPSFPVFTGDQATAYQYISNTLINNSNGNIRAEYVNNLSWATYQQNLSKLENTIGISQADFDAVQSQLNSEFGCLANIMIASQFARELPGIIGTNESNVINESIDLVNIAIQGSNVAGDVLNALQTVGLAIISATGAPGCIVAGMIQAGITLAEQLSDDNSGLTPPGPIAVAGLWQSFSNSFNATIQNTSTMLTACQTDWNRMQIFNELFTQQWPVSLSITNLSASQYASAAQNGMIKYAMQALMPAQWQVYELMGADGEQPSKEATIYTTSTGRVCYLADVQNGTTFPSSALMGYIQNAGINIDDIYEGVNGWCLAQAIFGAPSGTSTPYSHNLRITIANNTPNQVTAAVFLADDNYNPQSEVYSHSVTPNESMCGATYKDNEYYCIQLFDNNFGNGSPFATINLHMDLTFMSGGAVQIQKPVFNTANSTEQYTIPIYYGWDAGASITNGGWYSGAAIFNLCLA
jgi:hypothetical protein